MARNTKRILGLSDDGRVVRAIRPAYNSFLQHIYGKRGLQRIIDNEEPLRLRPQDRLIPEDYEPGVFRFLKETVKPGETVLDVGANVGVVAMLMARWVRAEGKVYAFEPSPVCRAALIDNLRLNHLSGRVTVSPMAVSDCDGLAAFYAAGTSGTSSLSAAHVNVPQVDKYEVSVTTIDSYCRSHSLSPSLIKIDVEGFEFQVLKGAKATLGRCRPTILVELHPMNWPGLGTSPDSFTRMLNEVGYRATPVEGQGDPFAEYGHAVLQPNV